MTFRIIQGDNRDTLKTLADNSIDAIVTDPPYGIDFLGKSWDANTGALETYQECLRVLKPGGHILAFSAARTYHHLAVTLEQAGFEIRDQIMWIYSSGFPKSQDVGRSIQRSLGVKETIQKKTTDGYNLNNQKGFTENSDVGYGEMKPIAVCTDPEAKKWEGWGTALKPAHEPIALARKPMKGSIKDNVLKHGVGALNIDATRIPYEDSADLKFAQNAKDRYNGWGMADDGGPVFQGTDKPKAGKRTDSFHNATGGGETQSGGDGSPQFVANETGRFPSNVIGEIPDYQKYFYCPKVSRKERHTGFDTTNIPTNPNEQALSGATEKGNNHPTVKPIELMKYLIKLVTPPGGVVLDPFNGSGSTGCAAVALGYEYIGCELDPAYVEISKRRIEEYNKSENNFDALFE